MLFPISINLSELLKRFRHLLVSVVCGAIEQELRDQGEVVRLVLIRIIIVKNIYSYCANSAIQFSNAPYN